MLVYGGIARQHPHSSLWPHPLQVFFFMQNDGMHTTLSSTMGFLQFLASQEDANTIEEGFLHFTASRVLSHRSYPKGIEYSISCRKDISRELVDVDVILVHFMLIMIQLAFLQDLTNLHLFDCALKLLTRILS